MRSVIRIALAMMVTSVCTGPLMADEYLFHYRVKGIAPASSWKPYEPITGEWTVSGGVYGCSNWSPATSSYLEGKTFTQSATDCKQDQVRTAQDREIDEVSGKIRLVGAPYEQTQTLVASDTRTVTGTQKATTGCLRVGASWGQGFWLVEPGGGVRLVWYGADWSEYVSVNTPNNPSYIDHGGYRYTRGSFSHNSSVSGSYYQPCRVVN